MHLADGLAHSRYTTDGSGCHGEPRLRSHAPWKIFASAEPSPMARGPLEEREHKGATRLSRHRELQPSDPLMRLIKLLLETRLCLGDTTGYPEAAAVPTGLDVY